MHKKTVQDSKKKGKADEQGHGDRKNRLVRRI